MVLGNRPVEQLAGDPSQLHAVLKAIFMESGAVIIETEIARRLLDKIGKDENRARRSPRTWLGATLSRGKPTRRISEREQLVLRQFLALASLPGGGPPSSMELTAAGFAYAFKPGN